MTPEQYVDLRDRIALLKAKATTLLLRKGGDNTFTPPASVRSAARRGLEMREKWKRGGLDNSEASDQGIGSGVQRAVNLKNGDAISLATVKRMTAFFSRHQKNYRPDKKEPDGGPTAGTIAWLLWGGNAGKSWANGIVSSVEKANRPRMPGDGDGDGIPYETRRGGAEGAQGLPPGTKVIDAGSLRLFRASDTADLHVSSGARAALGDGAYFGTSAADVAGYGGQVREYQGSGRLVEVRGDKEYDALRQLAAKEAAQRVQEHSEQVAQGKAKIDVKLLARSGSPSTALADYFTQRGISGVHYVHSGSNDHHTQVVLFDPGRAAVKKANAGFTPSTGFQPNDGKPEFMAYAKDGEGAPAGGPDAGDVHVPTTEWKKPKKAKRKEPA